jgi:hypothetical protein
MRKLFERPDETTVGFCERCGDICDDRCRRVASRERALLHQARLGVRV